ncbi:MAG: cytochrome b/b6 domain-containing protein [Alphaproteobacteria bacterium]|nr:cytochrome b/b6 domain-containing protein [Alphaproteobacteria bacterium]
MAAGGTRVRVWDGWIRGFHWLLGSLVAVSWWTAEEGHMEWHFRSGIAIFVLLVFRLLWGVFGSETARFASFLKGPGTILAYLRGKAPRALGHNPLGGLSVLALLGVLIAQTTLGLFAQDEDGIYSGPLSSLISYDASSLAGEIHHTLFNVVLGLIVLHISAITYYVLRGDDDILLPMITGDTDTDLPAPKRAPAWRGLVALAFAVALAAWVWSGLKGL